MNILITGAAGKIGRDLSEAYHLRLTDLNIDRLHTYQETDHEIMTLDVTDPEACQHACEGMDVVVHLAGDPSPNAGFYESLLDINIKGTFNVFRAAKDQGVQRVILASSAQTIEGYPIDAQVYPDMPTHPRNLYGVSKCFGESLASYFAYTEGLQSVAIRIGAYDDFQPDGPALEARDMSAYISPADLCDLMFKAITATNLEPFTILHGISNNRFKRLNLETTQKQVGYAPKSDAFALSQIALYDSPR
ncbi:NAD(P)-dependent oxidoreductase [Paenibacillus sp. PK1-4R]|uniref:NAD-dependent epimerase/dehydratase family protein n=1 Tax=Paenibacillus sp. PK1-4R TaxID=3049075 RepID=UPI0025A135D7|nr:NAD(P)-dependent oxidoreductase [Paenibacillus sp. PK1-4R]WJM08811.1 NAD(P)-dependent oxidoreductase [Paenibacillus sp. PK1-4R]